MLAHFGALINGARCEESLARFALILFSRMDLVEDTEKELEALRRVSHPFGLA